MSEKRRGLGRGLGALIPTGLDGQRPSGAERPADVFFGDPKRDNGEPTGPAAAATATLTEAPPTEPVSAPESTEVAGAVPAAATNGAPIVEAAREVAERGAMEFTDDLTDGRSSNGDSHQADHEYQAASPVLQEEQ